MIKIINIHHKVTPTCPVVYCGRGSALGNPFKIGPSGDRDAVCEKYDAYFRNELRNGNANMLEQVNEILSHAKTGDVSLSCYCAPRRCHCETIKAYCDAVLEKEHAKER